MKIKFVIGTETILELDNNSVNDEQEAKIVALKGMNVISYHFDFIDGTKLGDTESLEELSNSKFVKEIIISLKA